MQFPYVLIIVVVATCIGYFVGGYDERKHQKLKYRWECLHEGCDFKISSNNMDMTLALADSHEQRHG